MLPEIAEKSSRFVSIKEFVLEPIAGQWVADHSMASGTGLFNLRECRWEKAALDFAGIEPDRLSRLIPGDEPLSFKNKELLRAWRLDDDIMVFSGGGDGPMANLGSGAAEIGAVNIDLGTSGAARVVTGQPVVDKDGCLWCYALLSGRWTMGGILTNVGNAYQWLGEQVASFQREEPLETVLERLDTYASPIDAGAEGVFFLPYLRKTRSPYWDDRLTGTIYGLRADHDLRHITRALLEAIAYDIGTIIDCMNAAVPVKDRIILTGGLSKNKLMAQIIANVLNREILVPDNSEGSIAGAALIALHGAGLIKNYHFDSPAGPSAPEGSRFLPGPADAPRYRDLYRGYTNLIHKFQMME
jgi:gluconokinase